MRARFGRGEHQVRADDDGDEPCAEGDVRDASRGLRVRVGAHGFGVVHGPFEQSDFASLLFVIARTPNTAPTPSAATPNPPTTNPIVFPLPPLVFAAAAGAR